MGNVTSPPAPLSCANNRLGEGETNCAVHPLSAFWERGTGGEVCL